MASGQILVNLGARRAGTRLYQVERGAYRDRSSMSRVKYLKTKCEQLDEASSYCKGEEIL
jgi:hypothetical protein